MLFASQLKMIAAAAAAFAAPLAMTASLSDADRHGANLRGEPALIELAPGTVRYRVAGDFTRAGKVAEAPLVTARIGAPLAIMRQQVTAAEYGRCVADGACRAISDETASADRPAVMVSWRDADAYAAWLSRKTGETYRLPTDEEWAYAAGSRYQDDGLPVDEGDPSRRWLARYEREANFKSAEIDAEPKTIGVDQHLLHAHRARRGGKRQQQADGELRRARGRGPAPRLCHRFHSRRARRRVRGWRPAEQSRVPPGARAEGFSAANCRLGRAGAVTALPARLTHRLRVYNSA